MDDTSTRFDATPFHVRAVNATRHARNPIHTDEGARAAGFPGALVAGVTTYAYLTHPLLTGWGMSWLRSGTAEVRFRSPVFAGDEVVCGPRVDSDDAVTVTVSVGDDDAARAEVAATLHGPPPAPIGAGEALEPVDVTLDGEWGAGYGDDIGDPCDLCRREQVVHPAVWPALANRVVHEQVARSSWVHVRSAIIHHDAVPVASRAVVRSAVIRRFERRGERAVLDVRVEIGGRPVASIEHEAIVALPGT